MIRCIIEIQEKPDRSGVSVEVDSRSGPEGCSNSENYAIEKIKEALTPVLNDLTPDGVSTSLLKPDAEIVHCRRCNAEIIFLATAKGKSMPVDAETVKIGDMLFDHTRHTSHFATCKFAAEFRKPKS